MPLSSNSEDDKLKIMRVGPEMEGPAVTIDLAVSIAEPFYHVVELDE